ncbi:MAG: hypothetical protein EOO83_02900 [Oxalobacteraceae bacterium]|nr:MAG: hypothetical protein EOO83_02900 [Oxalobacteraceae bacterium]
MLSVRVAATAIAILFAGQAAAQTGGFDIDGIYIEAPLPSGFCLPSGAAVAKADLGVRSDPDNKTHMTVYSCAQMQNDTITDYFLVKSPKNLLSYKMTREEVLASLTKEMSDPDFSAQKLSSEAGDKATKSISEASGTAINVTTDIRPLGRDKDCAYMGGVVASNTGGVLFSLNVAGCITAVGDRIVMVFRYSKGTKAAEAAKLLPEARKFAMAMRTK